MHEGSCGSNVAVLNARLAMRPDVLHLLAAGIDTGKARLLGTAKQHLLGCDPN